MPDDNKNPHALTQLFENNRKDNTAFVVTRPIFTTLATVNTPLGPRVGAIFGQQGALQGNVAFTATLHLDAPDGPVVGTAHAGFPEEPVMQAVTTTVALSPTQLGPGTHMIHWVGAFGSYGVTAAHVFADLAVYPADIVVAGGQISVTVGNRGNLASTGGAVVVYDRDPSVGGAQQLAQLPLPAIGPGRSALVHGTINLAAAAQTTAAPLVYVRLEAPNNSPDLNQGNNLFAVGDLVNSQPPTNAGPSLFLPLISK